jgi:hypothetical protein
LDAGFYLAGALAFLIAMLGWADQIRGTQERTRILEEQLLREYGFRWSDLRQLIRNDHDASPASRLKAALRLVKLGQLKDSLAVALLKQLEALNRVRAKLEKRYDTRFRLVLAVCTQMLVSGVLLLLFAKATASVEVPIHPYRSLVLSDPVSRLCAISCIALISAILYHTWRLNREEEVLREIINGVDDSLRDARDSHAPTGK